MTEQPTIILVHGAWHGSWCWDEVASKLRDAGLKVIAVDLPGHNKPGNSRRNWKRMGDYVAHVRGVVQRVEGEVVLVGHSMGGLVTQIVLEDEQVQHGILVASIPRKGVGGALARLVKFDAPQVIEAAKSLSLWPMVATDERVKHHFFKEGVSDEVVTAAGAKMQNESIVAFAAMIARWPRPKDVKSPITVVAATHDTIFTPAEQADLAEAYGVPLIEIYCGHDIMLEPQHGELVDIIIERAGPLRAVGAG